MRRLILTAAIFVLALGGVTTAKAEIVRYDHTVDYASFLKFDRYLDVEIWTDHDEYYEGDNIDFSFKANEDCFVVVYNIDSEGEVHLLFPAGPYDDYHIQGGRIYNIPSRMDDYELTVQGPEGIEYLQIIASREPFSLDDWDNGLYCDIDPYDFMDFVNSAFFGCNYDCRRAYDMTSFMVKEWDDYYFQPVYVYDRPHWSYAGSIYIDYPFGASVYINGVYWGCAPLYIPRIYYGWHWVTVYDHYGYCWEDRINVVRRKSVVLNETVVRTKANVTSRYRDVRKAKYRDPVKNGYPDYKTQVVKKRDIQKTRQSDITKTRMQTSSSVNKRTGGQTTTSLRGNSSSKRDSGAKSRSTYDSRKQTSRRNTDSRIGSSSKRNSNSSQGSRIGSSSKGNSSSSKNSRIGSSSKENSSSSRKSSSSNRSGRSSSIKKSSGSSSNSSSSSRSPRVSSPKSSSGSSSSSRSSGSGTKKSSGSSRSSGNSGGTNKTERRSR